MHRRFRDSDDGALRASAPTEPRAALKPLHSALDRPRDRLQTAPTTLRCSDECDDPASAPHPYPPCIADGAPRASAPTEPRAALELLRTALDRPREHLQTAPSTLRCSDDPASAPRPYPPCIADAAIPSMARLEHHRLRSRGPPWNYFAPLWIDPANVYKPPEAFSAAPTTQHRRLVIGDRRNHMIPPLNCEFIRNKSEPGDSEVCIPEFERSSFVG